MRALVTGAGGFLGRHVVAELLARGDEVAALVRPGRPVPAELAAARVVRSDLRTPDDALAEAIGEADVVYHVAAGMTGGWRQMYAATVTATERLVATMRDADFTGRLVHVSTIAVYGANQLPRNGTLDEQTPLEPQPGRRDDYAWAKALQERVVATAPGEHVIVRPGTVYGPGRAFQHRLGRQVGERALLLFGGRADIPLAYVENVASLVAECGRHPDAVGRAFNAIDPDPMPQHAYLREYLRAQPHRVTVIPVPLTVLHAAAAFYGAGERHTRGAVKPPLLLRPYAIEPTLRPLRYAPSAAIQALGWTPPVSRAEGLRRTFGGGPISPA